MGTPMTGSMNNDDMTPMPLTLFRSEAVLEFWKTPISNTSTMALKA